jgi:fatty-acid desaturase
MPSRRRINWPTTMVLLLLHVGAVAALFVFTWPSFFAALFLIWVAGGLGISMGYHRLHTHRSYQVPLVLEYFFAICGALALQGGPIFWVATHRVHHQRADQPGDPHSPRDGAWWAHMGWILFGDAHQSSTSPIPASGFRTAEEIAALPGARLIREPLAITGPSPLEYAYPRYSSQRNIYRVPVP